MTALLDEHSADGDPVLLTRVRAGDTDAYAELFLRHRSAALAFARSLAGAGRADDLVAEAFAKVLSALQRDLGPTISFRAYLLTTIRSLHINGIRDESRLRLVEDYETLPPEPLTVDDDADARFDNATIAAAFRSLPERWQAVLWYGAVEGLSNDEIGGHLGLKANAVGQLGYRAREGLRQAYLDQHLARATEERCRDVLALLPAYVRGSVDKRKKPAIAEHLAGCSRCSAAMADLDGVNRRLGALLLPVVVGSGTARLGWPYVPGRIGHTLQRLISAAGLKTTVVVLAALVTGTVALGVPLGWSALNADRGHAPTHRHDPRPRPTYGPAATVLPPLPAPGGPTRPQRPGAGSRAHDHGTDTTVPPDDDRVADGPAAVAPTHPPPAHAAPLDRAPHRAPHQPHHGGGDGKAIRPGAAQDVGQATPPIAVHDARLGPLSITRTGLLRVTVVVPIFDLLPHATVTLDFTSLASAPKARWPGWTCTRSGLQVGRAATLTCVYDGPETPATSLQVVAVAAGPARVSATLADPAGVEDPNPGDNTVTSSFA